jgi:hypothetical protein
MAGAFLRVLEKSHPPNHMRPARRRHISLAVPSSTPLTQRCRWMIAAAAPTLRVGVDVNSRAAYKYFE